MSNGYSKDDLREAEALGKWRGEVNGDLKNINTQIAGLRDDINKNAKASKEGDSALGGKIDSVISMMHAVDMKSAKIGGITGLVVSVLLIVLAKVFKIA